MVILIRALTVVVGLSALAPVGAAAPAPARKISLGSFTLKAWDPRKEVFFQRVQVWRQGCTLTYRFTYRRQHDHALKLRLLLSLDAGPAATATPWTESARAGAQVGQGQVKTPGCWARKARNLKRVSFEVSGDAPRPVPRDGRVYLGRVTFNRWGSSGDVYYRHIRTWQHGCRIHFQFLYKRRTPARRRLRMRLTFDNAELKTKWVRSKTRGWREIVGSLPTPRCWSKDTKTLRTAGFESERY